MLAELTEEDLCRMLELDETLFVEHKKDLNEHSAYQLVSAVAAFANTFGGWVLLGVHNGKPCGSEMPWAAGGQPTLVDAIRDRLRGALDPLPAFEARVMKHADCAVGVVRVYESFDTPHVTVSNGAVFVREVAGVEDASTPKRSGAGARAERKFVAIQIRSRQQLIDLARRGELAQRAASELLEIGRAHV